MNENSDEYRFGRKQVVPEVHADPDHVPAEPLAPQPRKSHRRSKLARGTMVKFFNLLMTLAIFGVLGFVATIWYAKNEFEAPGPLKAETTIEIKKGATFNSIVPDLEAKKIIVEQGPLRIFARGVQMSGNASKLKAGEFAMKPGMSMKDVMNELVEGRAIQYTITLPEGWTSYRIMERIQFSEVLEGELPPIPAEGSMLPDTYAFPRGTTRVQAVQRMQEAQGEALAKIWAGRAADLPLKTPEELVILASIVEKETGIGSERAHVASVFVNRLRKGMKLQTDPTVIYGIWAGKGKPEDRGGLRVSELKRSTPYNTYIISALPPTPIANPGLEAMKAVANPLETEDLFFVADGTGGHVFAKSLQEHNANVAKWRKIEVQRKEEAVAAEKAKQDAEKNPETKAEPAEQSN